jgi:PIN domain nuclease of toxin-antitoxin system
LPARALIDTHVLIRCLVDSKKLSRDQSRVLMGILRDHEVVAISAITLWEIAMLFGEKALRLSRTLDELFADVENNPMFQVLPLSFEIAKESASLCRLLRDPADCIIAATARVHGLRLLTSDQRIIESNLVSTVA